MKKNANQIQFKVTPELLEAHAGEVDLAIDSRFPAKYFNKKARTNFVYPKILLKTVLQKGGVPATPSGTATLLRLNPSY